MIESYKYVGSPCDFFTYGNVYDYDTDLRSFIDDDEGDTHIFTILDGEFKLIESGYTNQEMIDRIEKAESMLQSAAPSFTEIIRNGLITGQEKVAASETQVAGNHYSKLKIQPMEYCLQNDLNYGQSNAIKYITRYKDKNGIEDLKKAIHCIELLIEFEEKDID